MESSPSQAERNERVRTILTAALRLAPADRDAYVREQCGSDTELLADLEALLARASTDASGAGATTPGIRWRRREVDLAQPAEPDPVRLGGEETPIPEKIGNCVILRCLGEGGMGVVYEGEQQRPKRRVAIKLMRADTWSTSLVARFRREAELLARLEHPGIARVYEAGHSRPWGDKGPELPYLVMELVEGSPINVHAARLDARQRLRLVGLICDAVQHAHERGVIHRDLKPANVLVDSAGQPRVLDFGVARALDGTDQALTAHTGTSQLVGTLPYMSPEQVAGKSSLIGARSDVYSLGVLAYELLCGVRPIPMAGLSLAEAVRQVQDVDPKRLGQMDPRLGGDIEAIVGKALEKEPSRRYASAAEMAADIERYLSEQPIQARPQSAVYRATKFVRRNTKLVALMAALFVVLVAGIAATTLMAVRANRARHEADRSAEAARWLSYRSSLAAALSSLDESDASAARKHLDTAPEELREWTWRHVSSRLDDAASKLDIGTPPQWRTPAIIARADGRLVVGHEGGVQVVSLEGDRLATVTALRGKFVGVSHDGLRALELRDGRWIERRLDDPDAAGVDLGQAQGGVAAPLRSGGWLVAVPGAAGPVGRIVAKDGTPRGDLAIALDPLILVSPDERFVATRRENRLVIAPLVAGGAAVDLAIPPSAMAFSSDSRLLVAVDGQGRADAWRLDAPGKALWTAKPVATIPLHIVAFMPGGDRFITVDQRGAVRAWRTSDATLDRDLGEVGYSNHALALAPDSSMVALGDALGGLRLIDLAHGSEVTTAVGATASYGAVAFLGDGARVAALDSDGWLRLFLPRGRRASPRLTGHTSFVYDVAVDGEGRIASIAWDGFARVWDERSGALLRSIQLQDQIGRVCALLPGGVLVTGCNDTTAAWDVATGAEIARLDTASPVRSLAALPGTDRVLYAGTDGIIGSWEPRTGANAIVATVGTGTREVRLAVASGRSRLAWTREKEAGVLEMPSGTPLWDHPPACDFALAIDISPDGGTVAMACKDGSLQIVDGATGSLQRVLGQQGGTPLYATAFHPDGRLLTTGSKDGSVGTWDLGRGELIAQMRGHRDYIHGMAFSPDGSTLATASADATVRIWETRTPPEILAGGR